MLRDPTLHRPPPPNLHCSESVEEGSVGSVTFLCSPPPSSALTRNLKFNCRKRSIGVLVEEEAKVDDKDLEEAYETVDPNFFDAGYTLAGATGFQIWAGTRLLLETLTWPPSTTTDSTYVEHPLLTYWREQITHHSRPQLGGWKPLRVLELGAGIGVVGTNLSAAGAHVLMTDLTTLVENATYPNILANCNNHHTTLGDKNVMNTPPILCDTSTDTSNEYSDCPPWLQPLPGVPIGEGWAATTPLDWTQPVSKQIYPHQYQNVDLIVASDCVWLVSMLHALLDTVAYIFHQTTAASSKPPTLLLSFQRRDTTEGDTSATFTTINRVIQSVQARGWKMECLAWRKVFLDSENKMDQDENPMTESSKPQLNTVTADEKEVFVFSIFPQ